MGTKNYEKRIWIAIRPSVELTCYGNQFNDYKSTAVKDGDGTVVRIKNGDVRLISVNNLAALESYNDKLSLMLDKLAKQNKQYSKLYEVLTDMLFEIQTAELKFHDESEA